MSKKGIIDAPAEIWLVLGDVENGVNFNQCAEVTWSEHQVFDHDVRYVRADLATLGNSRARRAKCATTRRPMFERYRISPGIYQQFVGFIPRPSIAAVYKEADENEGVPAFGLYGYDPEIGDWIFIFKTYMSSTIVRHVQMMFGVDLSNKHIAEPIEFKASASKSSHG